MKKIVVVNAGPRKGWNTDRLLKAAAKGAEESGCETEYIDLYRLERFTGCLSCFGCKLPKTFGQCVDHDGLYEVLEKIRSADGLIIGSPNYLGDLTSGFRALYERLIFPSLTYEKERPNCNTHMIPVLLITTSNVGDELYDRMGYTSMLEGYKKRLEMFVGPTEIFICGDTLQVNNYGIYNWTSFDPGAKKKHHDETFDAYLEKAGMMGKKLFG